MICKQDDLRLSLIENGPRRFKIGKCFYYYGQNFHNAVVIVVFTEASAAKVYLSLTLANTSTLSGSVVRSLRGGEGLSKMFCPVESNLEHLLSQCSIVYGKEDTGGLLRVRGD